MRLPYYLLFHNTIFTRKSVGKHLTDFHKVLKSQLLIKRKEHQSSGKKHDLMKDNTNSSFAWRKAIVYNLGSLKILFTDRSKRPGI